jgi:DNA-binding XRE family transcriptional regulator
MRLRARGFQNAEIGNAVRLLREELGDIPQHELARRIGISYQSVNNWERNAGISHQMFSDLLVFARANAPGAAAVLEKLNEAMILLELDSDVDYPNDADRNAGRRDFWRHD